jgi:hypothetical protein
MASPMVNSKLFEGDARPVMTQAILQQQQKKKDTGTVKRLVGNTGARRRGEKYP